jgi:hypothetical protein
MPGAHSNFSIDGLLELETSRFEIGNLEIGERVTLSPLQLNGNEILA